MISGLQYEPIIAHPAHDVWAFGIVLYYMCTGMSLFQEDFYSNVKDETLVKIHEFSDEFREHSLGSIINLKARNLASLLLQKDPLKRPPMSRVLQHPFLTGKSMIRGEGDEAEFDVFVSYRVHSDKELALTLYHRLTGLGLRVWLDSISLEPGLKWEDGFCRGLGIYFSELLIHYSYFRI